MDVERWPKVAALERTAAIEEAATVVAVAITGVAKDS